MIWNLYELKEWIENGCDKSVGESVTKLNISHKNLTTLPLEIVNLINLQEFYCAYNYLTILPEIGNFLK